MAFTLDYCEARASDAAKAAGDAKLANVRERELRSEAAWRAMSDRIRSIEVSRKERLEARLPN